MRQIAPYLGCLKSNAYYLSLGNFQQMQYALVSSDNSDGAYLIPASSFHSSDSIVQLNEGRSVEQSAGGDASYSVKKGSPQTISIDRLTTSVNEIPFVVDEDILSESGGDHQQENNIIAESEVVDQSLPGNEENTHGIHNRQVDTNQSTRNIKIRNDEPIQKPIGRVSNAYLSITTGLQHLQRFI